MVVEAGCEIPEDLSYYIEGKNTVWVKPEGDVIIVGITDIAQTMAGKVVKVRVKRKGIKVDKGRPVATMESGKWAGPVPAPVSGEVIEVNEAVEKTPVIVNQDPYGKGWLVKIKPNSSDEVKQLLSGQQALDKLRQIISSEKFSVRGYDMSWRYVRLPPQDPYHMITSFLAVGDHVSKGTKNTMLVFNSLETFVNVGFHQEVWLEVDLDYVRKNGIPVVRRDVGGGTVVITPGEVDYFLVMKSEDAPTNQSELYKKFLSPVASFLNSYGVKAEIREQDIVVGGRKISGNGAMTRGKSVILAGNVLVDVDVNVIAKCLRVPSAKFRDKLAKEMSEWITSMKRETGKTPSVEEVAKGLKKAFEEAGFSFSEEELTEDEVRDWNRLAEEKMRESWIYYKDLRHPELRSERCVKINFSVTLCHVDYKARKLIRITAKFSKEKVEEVSISGDFFVLTPRDFVERLEDRIRGIRVGDIEQVIRDTFNEFRPTIFGFDENDLINAFNEMLIKPEVQEIIS